MNKFYKDEMPKSIKYLIYKERFVIWLKKLISMIMKNKEN